MRIFARWLIAPTILASALLGCSFVELKPEAQKVRILATTQASRHCKHLGKVTPTTAASIAFIPRGRDSITEEIQNLARNHAASMHGDSIVAASPLVEDEQSFDVYRCLTP